MSGVRELSVRALTVAFAERQLLSRRRVMPVADAVRHLVAIQAQYHPSVGLALTTRLDCQAVPDVDAELARGSVRKATLMRGTLHVVSARDYPAFAAALREGDLAYWRRRHADNGIDEAALVDALRRSLQLPRSVEELRSVIAGLGESALTPREIMHTAKALVPLIAHVEAGASVMQGRPRFVLGDGLEPERTVATTALIARYLRGFGPASREDVANFTSLGLRDVDSAIGRIGSLRRYRDTEGRDLVDVPGAPLPTEDQRLPSRFLPKWDSALLGHAVRTRILSDEARPRVIIRTNGEVRATFLADGQVAGTWRADESDGRATLVLEPFDRAQLEPDLEQEGMRLLRLLFPSARSGSIELDRE